MIPWIKWHVRHHQSCQSVGLSVCKVVLAPKHFAPRLHTPQNKGTYSTGLETGCKSFLLYLAIQGLANEFFTAVLKQVLELTFLLLKYHESSIRILPIQRGSENWTCLVFEWSTLARFLKWF